ncbi:SDR family oxidoreductase [Bernardetia sp.]|uniref:SDR family oxidoreductase n=1 Tax=Bernardetia sp. TaxID=1937974 RepID=UPI0025BBDC6C|nr:SDR family oxidoreductase [Bernardetia sp.]
MTYFKNKIIWITGASSGIGEELVYALSNLNQNTKIIISARRTEELERVKNTSQNKENIAVLPLDLAKSDFEQKTAAAISFFGKIDILVHNGGISQRSYIKDTKMEVYRRIMEVNYFGYVGLTQAILPHFVEQQNGHFVVISSVLGKLSTPMRGAYASSKHALYGFFDGLRAEFYKDSIKVTMIAPGFIRTNVAINALTESGDKFAKMGKNTGKGYPADKCASQILKAIKNQKKETYVGKPFGKERLGLYVRRFFPNLFFKIARKQAPE